MRKIIVFFALFGLLGACSKANKNVNLEKKEQKTVLNIFVSIMPQKYLVESIGGKYVSVEVMLPPGQTPHDIDPSPKAVLDVSRCDYYVKIGIPFEDALIGKFPYLNSKLKFIDSIAKINRNRILDDGKIGIDPHVWLSPELDKKMAKNICDVFVKAKPQYASYFEENYKKLSEKLDTVDHEIKEELAPYKGRTFIVFHPAFGYFADRYNLHQRSIEVEGKSPSPKEFISTMEEAQKEKINVIFIEPEFDKSAALTLAKALNVKIITIDPLAENIPESLLVITKSLKKSFEQ